MLYTTSRNYSLYHLIYKYIDIMEDFLKGVHTKLLLNIQTKHYKRKNQIYSSIQSTSIHLIYLYLSMSMHIIWVCGLKSNIFYMLTAYNQQVIILFASVNTRVCWKIYELFLCVCVGKLLTFICFFVRKLPMRIISLQKEKKKKIAVC